MSSISARVLELLTLLQSRRHWSGEELARRLEISPRTLRRDVESLTELGYPITTTRGTGGGYQLAPGGSLPPLVLGEDEAAAVVLALTDAATGTQAAQAEAAISALAKIVQVLPAKVRRRTDALRHLATLPGPYGTPNAVDTAVLTTLALASRDHETITFDYADAQGTTTRRHVQPHHLVSLNQRVYLVAHDLDRADWRTFRVDRAGNPERTGRTFTPRPLPTDNPAQYVAAQVSTAGMHLEIVATVAAPAADIQTRLREWGTATPLGDDSCQVTLPASDLDWATFTLVCLEAPFTIHSPRAAAQHAAAWAARLTGVSADGVPVTPGRDCHVSR